MGAASSNTKLDKKRKDFQYKRASFRIMGDFFRHLFNEGIKGKKVTRNYERHMQDYFDKHFKLEIEKLKDDHESFLNDFLSYLT